MRFRCRHLLAISVTALAAIAGATGPVDARRKGKPPEIPRPACERANYPGDPVCDLTDAESVLPLPSSRKIRRFEDPSGFLVGDNISVDGKTNFNENRFGEAPLHKFHLRTQRKDANGGAQIDYKF